MRYTRNILFGLLTIASVCLLAFCPITLFAQSTKADLNWKVHDPTRPMAPVITPATPSSQEKAGLPPSDAIVLFNGTDLSGWLGDKSNGPAEWRVENGYMEAIKGKGGIHTSKQFGDCQLHVEWMTPDPPRGKEQDRGNSGVFLMRNYEVQVLDSYKATTYADGQAGALYGQFPPLVNATLPPGQWQLYDIVFHRPRFDKDGQVVKPAYATVFLNGVLIQDNAELTGPTAHKMRPAYKAHADKMPIGLQDHAHPVRFRNIWIRDLEKPNP